MRRLTPIPFDPPNSTQSRRWLLPALFVIALFATGCAQIAEASGWSSPAFDGDILVMQSDEGVISAFQVTDPTIPLNPAAPLWTYPSELSVDEDIALTTVYATPIIEGNTVYIAGYSGTVVALALSGDAAGRPLPAWGGPIELNERIVATPALHGGVLYVATEKGNLHSLSADSGAAVTAPVPVGGRLWAQPNIDGGRIYLGSIDDSLIAVDLAGGDTAWTRDIGSIAGDAFADSSMLYVPSLDGRIHALDLAAGGAERWPEDAGGGSSWFWGRPLLQGSVLYAIAVDGTAFAFNATTGAEQWRSLPSDGDEVHAAPIVVAGVLVIATRDGNIRGINANNGTELWIHSVAGERFYADPLLIESDNIIYADNDGGLWQVTPATGTVRVYLKRD